MSIRERVIIPALVALVTGLLLAGAVLSYCLIMGYSAAWSLLVGMVAAFITWIVRPQAGGFRPPAEDDRRGLATVIRVVAENNLAGDILRFGLPPDKLQTLAKGLAEGDPLSQVRWQKVLTRPELAGVVSEFRKFGYVRERTPGTPARGYELTPQGRAVVKYLAKPE